MYFQVLTIWEGTTNILSLDVLRAIAKSEGKALQSFHEDVEAKLASTADRGDLKTATGKVRQASGAILQFAGENTSCLEFAARDFAYSLSRTYMGNKIVFFLALVSEWVIMEFNVAAGIFHPFATILALLNVKFVRI